MKSLNLYICDPDEAYLGRLDGFIQHREHSPFCVRTFTGLDGICKDVDPKSILLLNSQLFPALCQHVADGTLTPSWQKLLLLDEGGITDIPDEGLSTQTGLRPDRIDKYQSAVNIYDYLLNNCAGPQEQLLAKGTAAMAKDIRVIGIYAPDTLADREGFSLNLARSCTQPCLYITFEEFSAIEGTDGSLSDLIVAIKEKSGDLSTRMRNFVTSENGLDILPPAICPYDLKEVGEEEWFFFFQQLILEGIYRTIVISFGRSLPDLILLELCTELILPCTAQTEEKCHKFRTLLKFMDKQSIIKKIEIQITGGVHHGLL